jgi:hypothetical protein
MPVLPLIGVARLLDWLEWGTVLAASPLIVADQGLVESWTKE